MATYVNDLRLKEIATGDESGTWGTSTNTNLELIGEALGFGTEAITTNADTHTTTVADGSTDPGRAMYLKYTGTLDSACTITIAPNTISRMQFIENGTSGSQNIIISQGSGANITIPPGDTKAVYLDGAGSGAAVVDAFASLNVVDLKVEDDLTVTDDLIVNGDIDLEGAIDVNGTANLDVVDIDGAVDMASTLQVDGAITSSAGATITTADNTDTLSLVSTDADANAGPNLRMYRNSGSPADSDLIGRIDFEGRNDNSQDVVYGSISGTIIDASDGAEGGMLSIKTMLAGSEVSRIRLQTSETVLNEGSNNIDLRVESDGNANMLFVDGGNDRVGIGTGTPEQAVHIIDTSNPASTTASVIIEGQRDGTANLMEFRAKDNGTPSGALPSGQGGIVRFTGFDGTDFEELAFIGFQAEAIVADGDAPGRLIFGTTPDGTGAATEKMRIDSTGVLKLIGSRSTFVDASEDSAARSHMFVTNDAAGDFSSEAGHLVIQARTHTSVYRDIIFAGGINNASDLMRITGEGKVGISTSSPSSLLHVDGSFSGTLVTFHQTAGSSGDDRGLDVETSSTGTTVQRWLNSGSELARLTGGGAFVIGNTSVVNSAAVTVQSNDNLGLVVGQTGTNAYRNYRHIVSTGIHTFASSNNTASLSNAGAWTNASDIAYKNNIVDTVHGLETIKALQPRDYKLKASNEADTGFIAQEVESVLPQFVIGEEGHKNVNYAQITAVLTKAMQELEARVTTLEG